MIRYLLTRLLAEAREMPVTVNDDSGALLLGALIKRMRDVDSRIESVRGLEKEPYLRGGNAVDAFFNAWRDKIGRRNKNDRSAKPAKPGATDVLQARINDYQNRKIAEENARQEAARREADRRTRRGGSAGLSGPPCGHRPGPWQRQHRRWRHPDGRP
jgi:hypothetical protein